MIKREGTVDYALEKSVYVEMRISRLKEKMSANGIDAVIIRKPETAFYFSNFNPVLNSHPAFVVVTLDAEPCLLVHSIRCAHAKEEGALKRVELYGKWGANVPLAGKAADAIRLLVGKEKLCLGMELDDISMDFYQEIQEVLHPDKIVSVSGLVNMMKIIKDEYEISCIRKSARLVDRGVETAIHALERGCSEAEAATEGQYAMRKLWHEKFPDMEVCGFGTSEGGMIDSLHVWCLSNGHIAYGCDCPKHYHPQNGDLKLPMAWAKTGGYHAENERTIIIGELDSYKRRAYDGMLRARESIFNILRPGTAFEDLYRAAAQVYTDYGFGDILPGRVGHGIGCSAHEFPSLAMGNKIALKPGMVITVEPGLMDKGWGGVRHSDTVLITEEGYESLTKYNMGEISIQIRG